MGFFKKKHECPDVGKTIDCVVFGSSTMEGGNAVKLKIEEDFIEIIDFQKRVRINWVYSKKDGTNYYFKGTDDFHQWIIGKLNITHTTMEGHVFYLRI